MENEQTPTAPGNDLKQLVRQTFNEMKLTIRRDGRIERKNGSFATYKWLKSSMILRAADLGEKPGHMMAALEVVLFELQEEEFERLIAPLFAPLSMADRAKVEGEFDKIAGLFKEPATLVRAAFAHHIWQTKRKIAGLPVQHHMMTIVHGAQKAGKTVFVGKLLEPLGELATATAVISDVSDPRSQEIFSRFYNVNIDDMAAVERKQIPVLKAMITAHSANRRELGTSYTQTFSQNATLIGTANRPVAELVLDDTGLRRFLSLEFRNGNVSAGGDPNVYKTVNAIDYLLCWKSIDHTAASPIEACLDEVTQHQVSAAEKSPVFMWASTLDPNHEAIAPLRAHNQMGSKSLFELFSRQSKTPLTQNMFGREMNRLAGKPGFPFLPAVHRSEANYYPAKPGFFHGEEDEQGIDGVMDETAVQSVDDVIKNVH